MSGQILLWRLGSAAVTDDEAAAHRRRGYWMRLARERSGMTIEAAAEVAGLKRSSGSSVSLWERGKRPIALDRLRRLSRAYGVPITFLVNPEPTDEERLESAIRSASDAERRDWEGERDQAPGVDDEPDAGPHRLPA